MCRAAACECEAILSACCPQTSWPSLIWTLSRVGTVDPVGMACPLPKATGATPLPRFQNRACAFPFTRLLSDAAPVMSTIPLTGLGDALSALHTYLGQAGFMSYACLLVPLPSTPPLPRQPILDIAPRPSLLGRSLPGHSMRLTTCSTPVESHGEVTPFLGAVWRCV
jgi:hypothetical protein